MFNNLSLLIKIVIAFVVTSLISACIGILSYSGFHRAIGYYKEICTVDLSKSIELGDMRENAMALARNVSMLANDDFSDSLKTSYKKKIATEVDAFEKAAQVFANTGDGGAKQQELYKAIREDWNHLKELKNEELHLIEENHTQNRAKIDRILTEDFETTMAKFSKNIAELDEELENESGQNVKNALSLEGKTVNANIGLIVLSSFAFITLGSLFGRSISGNINTIVRSLTDNANQIAAASKKMASSSNQLSQATAEQAASLEETAASLEEISSMIAKATDNAQMATESSIDSQNKASDGQAAIAQMRIAMEEIRGSNEAIMKQIDHSNGQMSEIVRVIREIGDKTQVINDIVFQTKLLSFNASVEAARAGEQGKGFAVVAEEIGSLAQMSGNAAKEITDMLTSSIQKVESIADNTKEQIETLIQRSKAKIDSGAKVANQCAEVLTEIVESATRVTGLAKEISSAASEQSQGVTEINKAVAQLDVVTQTNAATSQETANASEALALQAESLKAVVADLIKMVEGNKTPDASDHV